MADDPMWCLVLFDLPTLTATNRRDATTFRNFLLDRGFSRVQLSVYVKYWPSGGVDFASIKAIKRQLPPKGLVRIIAISDRQWSSGVHFFNATEENPEPAPSQLAIF